MSHVRTGLVVEIGQYEGAQSASVLIQRSFARWIHASEQHHAQHSHWKLSQDQRIQHGTI